MKTMLPLIVAAVSAPALLAAVEVKNVPATPAQHRQAGADCEPHGGPTSALLVRAFGSPDRVDAVCKNGVRISRDI